jgi:hypothetical protein
MFLRNIGNYLQFHMALQPRGTTSQHFTAVEPQTSNKRKRMIEMSVPNSNNLQPITRNTKKLLTEKIKQI